MFCEVRDQQDKISRPQYCLRSDCRVGRHRVSELCVGESVNLCSAEFQRPADARGERVLGPPRFHSIRERILGGLDVLLRTEGRAQLVIRCLEMLCYETDALLYGCGAKSVLARRNRVEGHQQPASVWLA